MTTFEKIWEREKIIKLPTDHQSVRVPQVVGTTDDGQEPIMRDIETHFTVGDLVIAPEGKTAKILYFALDRHGDRVAKLDNGEVWELTLLK